MSDQIRTDTATFVEFEAGCGDGLAILDGRIDVGATVPCPHGDHDHRVLRTLSVEVARNIRIIPG